jgi:hypothetical protein
MGQVALAASAGGCQAPEGARLAGYGQAIGCRERQIPKVKTHYLIALKSEAIPL